MLKKSLSQHLIKDKNITNKMVRATNIDTTDTVVEVGAGHGDLTQAICKKAGSVYAIELDRTCEEYLAPLEREYSNLKVIFGDVLKTPFVRFKGEKNLKIVGNIPYQITAPILFKILEERAIIESAYLTMQKEIALRIVSKTSLKTYGSLSAACQMFSRVKVLFFMKPGLFVPPPKIESAFLSMEIKEEERETDNGLMDFMKACFQNKRKYLKYALTKEIGPEKVESLYRLMNFPPSVRAEELEPGTYKKMYEILKKEAEGSRVQGIEE
jgi:16S rRNA (adenine1518-N6/adenine1519-N6)-dimethyltransferase